MKTTPVPEEERDRWKEELSRLRELGERTTAARDAIGNIVQTASDEVMRVIKAIGGGGGGVAHVTSVSRAAPHNGFSHWTMGELKGREACTWHSKILAEVTDLIKLTAGPALELTFRSDAAEESPLEMEPYPVAPAVQPDHKGEAGASGELHPTSLPSPATLAPANTTISEHAAPAPLGPAVTTHSDRGLTTASAPVTDTATSAPAATTETVAATSTPGPTAAALAAAPGPDTTPALAPATKASACGPAAAATSELAPAGTASRQGLLQIFLQCRKAASSHVDPASPAPAPGMGPIAVGVTSHGPAPSSNSQPARAATSTDGTAAASARAIRAFPDRALVAASVHAPAAAPTPVPATTSEPTLAATSGPTLHSTPGPTLATISTPLASAAFEPLFNTTAESTHPAAPELRMAPALRPDTAPGAAAALTPVRTTTSPECNATAPP
ncbi:hypothetical protein CYMTET_9937 [Cymbomonas tetramitiformis]|uniref:Uncharacterized protein n=2 Tax=Cymbomonas tetramitiformis TaxID=36881 RepID=A0AAE0GQJ2_9CHLO|nr:hypothetical protein CYMTET_9937 [Cymbomonas tetramitiformis]